MGVYGEILYPLSDLTEIWHQSSSKTSKNNIAKNSVALGHEMDNTYFYWGKMDEHSEHFSVPGQVDYIILIYFM